ncbi:hypothetical protein [Leptospira alstonii]|uniref:Uncharacterized protein n=1 Tax=Leptospira alstonii serovar Sichuan str. 79601 TaxID=1218565 RepID=M6CU80_9LEPT|nr:hypothetical protein [Leptospira alstonii]AGS80469.1 hypothetical protein LEP1GSC193_0715 [Leptospira phage vB_LalZ_80412-LE1]EMJ95467.1 hypothetical protein LEP1GSC194_3516 [Leptospira alstonii serovar Sichuan str. 79601]
MERIREEYHIYKHMQPTENSPRLWGAIGQSFKGKDARKKAIEEATHLQETAPEGVEYSVQKYVYSEKSKYRPVKTKIWRNGNLIAA